MAQEDSDREVAQCHSRYQARKPMRPLVHCLNEAHLNYTARIGSPNMDLARLAAAQLFALAERYDAGRMTDAQFEAEKAMIVASYTSQEQHRRNASTMADAAADQAWAARKPTTCQRIGNLVQCF